jgi:DNA-binding response OmpR family regulator
LPSGAFRADDYITKPFSMTELVARVKAHLARYERLTKNAGHSKKADEIDFGWMQINQAARRVVEQVYSVRSSYTTKYGVNMYGDIKTVWGAGYRFMA